MDDVLALVREMEAKSDKLPVWARGLLGEIRRGLKESIDRTRIEIDRLRRDAETNQRRYSAMTELIEAAALGKHLTAAEILAVIRSHDLIAEPKP